MLRFLCGLVAASGIYFIETQRQAVAATESESPKVEREEPAPPPAGPSLIQLANDGLSKLSSLSTSRSAAADMDGVTESPDSLVWVRMSRDYLADYVERDVDREKPACDQVLGITFTGESRTTGRTRLVLHPSEDGALGEVVFEGKIRSQTTGRKGPVTLHYLAHSTVRATKRIMVGESGFETRPAAAQAPTRLTLVDVDAHLPRLRGLMAERIARRRAAANWSQANAIVSNHRERDVRRGLDERLGERVAEIQSQVAAHIASLKLGEREPPLMRSRSTPRFIEVALYRGGADVQRPPMPRFEVEGDPDIAVRIHRTMLPHLLADAELRARFAPVAATVIRGFVQDRQSGDQISLRPDRWFFGSDWLELDIVDAKEPGAPRLRTAEQAEKAWLR